MQDLAETKRLSCHHYTVRKINNKWFCVFCNLEFVPKPEKKKA
jgi:hypothetical protein